MTRIVQGKVIEAVIQPWAGCEGYYGEPRYELARRDEPSMRNLIRAELLPHIRRWDDETIDRLRTALALALKEEIWPRRTLESYYSPVAFPEYGEKFFWLWVWDELFHDDLPVPQELDGLELDWSEASEVGLRLSQDAESGDWLEIFEQRSQVRFRLRQQPKKGA